MAVRDGERGRWSYREEENRSSSYYSISSSSGTLSTAYTSSTGSHIMSSGSLVAAMMHWADFESERDETAVKRKEQIKHMESFVQGFFGGDAMSVLERWLTELGVEWVLHLPLADAASAGKLVHTTFDARSWIRALAEIVEIIGFTASIALEAAVGLPIICEEGRAVAADDQQFLLLRRVFRRLTNTIFRIDSAGRPHGEEEPQPPDTWCGHDHGGSMGLPVICEEEGPAVMESEEQKAAVLPDPFQFAKFLQVTMLKMLPFVDFIVSEIAASNGLQVTYEKLSTLLSVHGALSKALPQIARLSSFSRPSAEVSMIQRGIVSILAAKEVEASEAIWSTMTSIRALILEQDGDDGCSSGTETLQGSSSDIHKATRSVASYIRLLRANYSSLAPIVSTKYVSHNAAVPPLDSMIIEMASCLEEELANKSESFPNRSLRFLFLLNNSYYISQQVEPIWSVIESNNVATLISNKFLSFMKAHTAAATRKVGSYMESYLQASWAPVLSCLSFNPSTPLCLGKSYSPLPKFESEFQKTYATQKLWKVPDPGLRKSLRKAIIKKIMPGYTKYIEDHNITNPRVAPQELEEMLQELFEG